MRGRRARLGDALPRRFYRGIEHIDWLVNVLVQNVRDMAGFLVIVGTFIAFFALAFRLLFSSHPCVEDWKNCFNEMIEAPGSTRRVVWHVTRGRS